MKDYKVNHFYFKILILTSQHSKIKTGVTNYSNNRINNAFIA